MAELALTGARELLAEAEARAADDLRRHRLRQRLTARLRSGEALDADAATEVRETGWARA